MKHLVLSLLLISAMGLWVLMAQQQPSSPAPVEQASPKPSATQPPALREPEATGNAAASLAQSETAAKPSAAAPTATATPQPAAASQDGGPDGVRRRMGPGGFGPGVGPGPGGFGGMRRRDPAEDGGGPTEDSALSQTIRMDGEKVVLQFPGNPVIDLLSIYELLTGLTLVKDSAILEGAPISLATPRAVDKAEAIKLIEATLFTNGYAIVMEPSGKSARILPARTQSANAVQFSQGLKFYTKAEELPPSETLVTYFMKLENLDPEQAASMLSGHIGLGVYGRMTPVLTPAGLLITESSSVLRQLIAICQTLDQPATSASLVTKFIALEHADAATVAQIIQATLTAQAQEKETKGVNTIRGESVRDGKSDGKPQSSDPRDNAPRVNPVYINGQWVIPGSPQAPQPTAQVVADTRLNQILVVASAADYTYIASLVAEFDKPLKHEEPYERKLRYAAAIDVISAVVDLLQEPQGSAAALPGGGTLQGQRQQSFSSSSSQLLGGRTTTGTRGGQVLSSSSGSADSDTASSSSAGIGSRADVIQGPTQDNAPISVLVGKTRVVADPMTNSILVVGRKSEIEKVGSLLDKLDRRPAQVYLATVIGQLTLGDGFEFGVDYLSRVARNGQNPNFTAGNLTSNLDLPGNNYNVRRGEIPPLNVTGINGNLGDGGATGTFSALINPVKGTNGLNLYGAIGNGFEAFVSALETTNRFKVLSRPSVFALNNRKAVITSGSLIPVPAQTVQNLNANNAGTFTTTIDYRDVVLKLEVVPLINEEGEVSLTIAQINDTVTSEKVIANNTVPVIATEQIVTTVNVADGKTIVLGGLISDAQKKDRSGTPVLSRIPGLGALFRRDTESNQRKELLIFIQPTVIHDDQQMQQASQQEQIRTSVGPESLERHPQRPAPGATIPPLNPEKRKPWIKRIFSRD